MKITHPTYGIVIDTNSEEVKSLFDRLNTIYKEIPKTTCVMCPNKTCVEADCCKTFSPPILLIEFLNILCLLEKKSISAQEKRKLLYDCFKSFLNIESEKPCILLNETLCSIYSAAPFACRMFGLYDNEEWSKRLKNYSKELKLPEDKVPFFEQCKGINLKPKQKNKRISRKTSDILYRQIHEIDVDLFGKDKADGAEIVFSSMTYIPFDAHFLAIQIGPEKLDQLAEMRIKAKKLKDSENFSEYLSYKKNIQDFLKEIERQVFNAENIKGES